MNPRAQAEGLVIIDTLGRSLPTSLDGREAIQDLKASGSSQWRQMEWLGWWFEHYAQRTLISAVGGSLGPTYGNTGFDYRREFVWDLKAHPLMGSNGSPNRAVILNDIEAMERCIAEHEGLGYVIAEGNAHFDTSGAFKAWHDEFKGGVSEYERKRVARGAGSRARKDRFSPTLLSVFWFDTAEDLSRGVRDGWVGRFQEGMRNSNGSPRRAKYQMLPALVPARHLVMQAPVSRPASRT